MANTATCTRLRVTWYGGTTRNIEIATGTGHSTASGRHLWQSVRYISMMVDDVGRPCIMRAVVISNTDWSPGVLKTLAVITRRSSARLGARGIDAGRGHATWQHLLAIRCLLEG